MTPALLGNLSVSLALAFSLLGLALALLAHLQGCLLYTSDAADE